MACRKARVRPRSNQRLRLNRDQRQNNQAVTETLRGLRKHAGAKRKFRNLCGQLLACATASLVWLCLTGPELTTQAQTTTATISGVVVDQHGDGISKAGITVRHLQTGTPPETLSHDPAPFRLPHL